MNNACNISSRLAFKIYSTNYSTIAIARIDKIHTLDMWDKFSTSRYAYKITCKGSIPFIQRIAPNVKAHQDYSKSSRREKCELLNLEIYN